MRGIPVVSGAGEAVSSERPQPQIATQTTVPISNAPALRVDRGMRSIVQWRGQAAEWEGSEVTLLSGIRNLITRRKPPLAIDIAEPQADGTVEEVDVTEPVEVVQEVEANELVALGVEPDLLRNPGGVPEAHGVDVAAVVESIGDRINDQSDRIETQSAEVQRLVQHMEQLTRYLKSERSGGVSLWDVLRRPQNTLADELSKHPYVQAEHLSAEVCTVVAIEAKYVGYLAKQDRLVADLQSLENRTLPQTIDYHSIEHLRLEAREKLSKFRPETLAQAARIGGITPSDITVIQVFLKKLRQSS